MQAVANVTNQSVEQLPWLTISIVLIDNSADASLSEYAKIWSGQTPNFHYKHVARAGIPVARNAALEEAMKLDADYIAFVDDDEIVEPYWLHTMMMGMDQFKADVVNGASQRCGTLEEALEKAAAASKPTHPILKKMARTASTCNVIFKAHILETKPVLRFDEDLITLGGSDADFFMRAHDRGAKIARLKNAYSYEVWPEDRQSLEYQLARAWRVGVCTNYRYRKNRSSITAAFVMLARSAEKILRASLNVVKSVTYRAFKPDIARREFEKAQQHWAFITGCWSPYFGKIPDRYY